MYLFYYLLTVFFFFREEMIQGLTKELQFQVREILLIHHLYFLMD